MEEMELRSSKMSHHSLTITLYLKYKVLNLCRGEIQLVTLYDEPVLSKYIEQRLYPDST